MRSSSLSGRFQKSDEVSLIRSADCQVRLPGLLYRRLPVGGCRVSRVTSVTRFVALYIVKTEIRSMNQTPARSPGFSRSGSGTPLPPFQGFLNQVKPN